MISRMLWGLVIGSLAALVWIGYKRGAFERDNMRYGMDRVKEGLQSASHRAREGLRSARDRIRLAGEQAEQMSEETVGRIDQATNM